MLKLSFYELVNQPNGVLFTEKSKAGLFMKVESYPEYKGGPDIFFRFRVMAGSRDFDESLYRVDQYEPGDPFHMPVDGEYSVFEKYELTLFRDVIKKAKPAEINL